MDLASLTSSIEALAVEVKDIDRGQIFTLVKGETNEGEKFNKTHRTDIIEYCNGGHKDKVSLHQVCMRLFRDALKGLEETVPEGDAILYWRCRPVYEEHENYLIGKMTFKVRFRLGWGRKEN